VLFLSGGDDDDSFSPVLYLLVGQLDLFASEVLERLGPTARASLTRAGSAFRGVFPFGFPRAETMNGGGGAARVLKLKEFVGRRAAGVGQGAACPWDGGRVTPPLRAGTWMSCSARVHGCPWGKFRVTRPPRFKAPLPRGCAAVGAGARFSP